MKKLLAVSLLCTAMLCGCSAGNGDEISETAVSETSSITVTTESTATTVTEKETTTTITTKTATKSTSYVTSAETSASETTADKEYNEYVYSPPDAAFDVEFVRDNIICSVDYQYYPNDETAELPEYIFADINSYANEWISNAENDYSFERIGVYMFDINSDGLDEYIVIGEIDVKAPMLYPPYIIEKLYIQDGNNGFQAFDFPASSSKYGIEDYILSTKTNGYNDFIGIGIDSFFTAVYDGNSAYYEAETFCTGDYRWEYLDNDILKITVYTHSHENDIAVAKPLHDSDYIENMLIYSSLPDGTPSVSVPQMYGSNIFEFYVKRTDKAPEKWNDFWVGPIEIKYIPA